MSEEKRFLVIGAHPDDADLMFGGTALKAVRKGCKVKFISTTNGDAGHYSETRENLAIRRDSEAQEVVIRSGIEAYEILDNHDGELIPSLENRKKIITRIRVFQPDVVISHRLYDYHADHRATAQLVQDSAYLVMVPLICPDVPVPEKEPIYMFSHDSFKSPAPFSPAIAVDIDNVLADKIQLLDCHVSQFYEWLPYIDGNLNEVPGNKEDRVEWLAGERLAYYRDQAAAAGELCLAMKHAETFELSEYGRKPKDDELTQIFHF